MSWPREAASDYTKATGGYLTFGYLGKHMKPLIEAVGMELVDEPQSEREVIDAGWAVVRPAWQRYCREQDIMFQSVPHFARTFGQWSDRPRGEGRVPVDRARQMFKAAGVTPPAILPEYFNSPEAVQKAIEQHRKAS